VSARARAVVAKLPSYLMSAAYLPTNVRELRTEAAGSRATQERLERALRDHAARQVRFEEQQARFEEQQARFEEQQARLAEGQTRLAEEQGRLATMVSGRLLPGVEEVAARSAGLLQRTEERARAQESLALALREQLGSGLEMLTEWVSLLQAKMEMLALDLRERVAPRREADDFPEPRVVDADRLRRKLDAMGGKIRVNLGCGEKPLGDYVNIDFREVPHVDVVADARRLPFEEKSLSEIASSHLVEHFRPHHFETVVLPYWRSLLRVKGLLRTVCPNWEEMLRRVQHGDMSLEDFRLVTFGAQDYFGDEHFSMYTPQTFAELLERSGFGQIEVVVEARQNGLCPEMEIIAEKGDSCAG
jgi:predicted SAM-dependent methyltransferase